MSTAIAIFVKTPGYTPLKTRLADAIGAERAEQFHRLSALAVGELAFSAAEVAGLTAYWAVAERNALADPLWSSLETLHQGEGGLGERLDRVYSSLLERHGSAILIGADAPQMTAALMHEASRLCEDHPCFVTGPADDGGFYLFGGSLPIPRSAWIGTAYSQAKTLQDLECRIGPLGKIHRLPALFDVDTADELKRLHAALGGSDLLPGQRTLRAWLEKENFQ